MSVILDPVEVRYHLQQMGFNVSDMQLMQFTKDLKKLIKHDQQHRHTCHCKVSHYESSGGSSYADSSVTSSTDSSSGGYFGDKENVEVRARRRSRTISHNAEYSDLDRRTATITSLKTHDGQQPRSRSRKRSTSSIRGRSTDHVDEVRKSKSSFIRGQDSSQQRTVQRCDPVTLYHKYQALWQQQKAPGEDNHAELRWSIREKMLGAEVHPQPKPLSRASSMEVLIRRHTRM